MPSSAEAASASEYGGKSTHESGTRMDGSSQRKVEQLLELGASLVEAQAIAREDELAQAAADVPSCVSAVYKNPRGPYQDVYVTNDCATTVRVKVIWSFATDSRCYSIAPGDTIKDHHLNQYIKDRWDGLKTC